jgi:hypothetical protein
MAKGGKKYRLLLYEYMLNRWWPMTFLTAFFIFFNVGVLWGAEWYFKNPAENPLPTLSFTGQVIMLAVGGMCLAFTVFLLIIRKMAYVQLFNDHMQLATPFLRLNVSYKRIHKVTTAQMFNLFPPKSLSGWNRELLAPISGNTAIVVHLKSYPMSRPVLRMFLSPFFFYDKTPHFIFVVADWMALSVELDSRRTGGGKVAAPRQQAPKPRISSGLLDDLKRK